MVVSLGTLKCKDCATRERQAGCCAGSLPDHDDPPYHAAASALVAGREHACARSHEALQYTLLRDMGSILPWRMTRVADQSGDARA